MLKYITAGDLEKALQQVAFVVAKSPYATKSAVPVFQMLFKQRVEDFMERNKEYFEANGDDIDNYEADALARFSEYYNELKPFLDEDLSGPFEMFKRELRENNLNYSFCRDVFSQVNDIICDFLLEVFIKNEKTNFQKLIENVLWKSQFKPKLKMQHLRRKSMVLYENFIKIFIENLEVIKKVYLNKEPRKADTVYINALNKLFDELMVTAGAMLDKEIYETSLSLHFPANIFKDWDAYFRFMKIHARFVSKLADLAFLYRKMYGEKYIVATDTLFRDWYNSWENRNFAADNYFKPMHLVDTDTRKKTYDAIVLGLQ